VVNARSARGFWSALPFVILTLNARSETFDFSVLDARPATSRRTPLRTFVDGTFPLIRPSIVGAGA